MTIASSLINAGGAVRALTSGPGVLLANRATKFLLWSNLVADGVSGLLIAAEGVQQIAAIIDNDALRPEQKRAAVLRIITNLIMTGALLAVSAGQLREHRTRMETNFGKAVAAKLGDEVAMTLSMLDDVTLQALKTAGDQDLVKLAGVLRHEPALMNTLKTESRLARALPLMKGGTPDDLRFAIMRATAHEAGVSVANSEAGIADLARGAGAVAGDAGPRCRRCGRPGRFIHHETQARLRTGRPRRGPAREATTIEVALKDDDALAPGVKHGIHKVKSRNADGVPIPGEHHLTIVGGISKSSTTKKGTQVIKGNGDRVLKIRNGADEVSQGNLFDKWAKHM